MIADRNQYAVLWTFYGYNNQGESTVNQPTELRVRWEVIQQGLIGENSTSTVADVAMWVEETVAIGSLVRAGQLVDLPATVDALYEVVGFEEIPDIKGRTFEKVCLLKRFRESLPTVV